MDGGGGGAPKCEDDNPTVTIVHKYVLGRESKVGSARHDKYDQPNFFAIPNSMI